jgi:pimeloyl-ACP methyl ester carboxylesterase
MRKTVPVTNATIVLDDDGDGVAVLLLHGFPATGKLWSSVAPSLVNAGYRVLVPDLVGYGGSGADASERLDMEHQARWLLEMLDALGVARAVVVAHDVGSAAAQLLLSMAPQRVRGLVVLDGVYAGEWAMEAITSIQTWVTAQAGRLYAVLARRLGKSAALREMLAAYAGEQGGLRLIRAARDLDPRQTLHLGETLRAIGAPALVLWGEHDEFLPIGTVARPLAELLGAELVMLPGAHFTPLDCPQQVATALIDFLARLSQNDPSVRSETDAPNT